MLRGEIGQQQRYPVIGISRRMGYTSVRSDANWKLSFTPCVQAKFLSETGKHFTNNLTKLSADVFDCAFQRRRDLAQTGVKSVETAIKILIALTGVERPQMLTDIARRTSMHPAKVHRYLISFIRQGMIRQDPNTALYMWGPLALDIGAAALRSVSFIRIAAEEAGILRDEAGATVAVAVWGTHGATHVLVEEARKTVVTKSQLGSVLPLLTSATGRVFAAFLPDSATKEMIDAEYKEITRQGRPAPSRAHLEKMVAEVRKNGISQALGDFSPGIHALCCPVLDHKDAIVGAITVLAPSGEFDPDLHGPVAQLLRATTTRISDALGRGHLKTGPSKDLA